MPEMDLRQPGFTFRVSGSFREKNERIQKFKETGESNYIY